MKTRVQTFRNRMTRVLVIGCLCLGIGITFTQAQTVLINPNGDGGFDNGSTFAANGWSVSNSANNPWYVGTPGGAAPMTGNKAYISDNAGSTNTYTPTSNATNYFWRDITVPSTDSIIHLQFNWAQQGENSWDLWQVFIAPTSINPVGVTAHPGSGTTNVPGGIAGATFLANGSIQAGVQTTSLLLPKTLAGTTFRIIFSWKNETGGTQPPASIDNISLISRPAYLNIVSAASGNWTNPATWTPSIIPLPSDSITIAAAHTVALDINGLSTSKLTISGTLEYAAVATTFSVSNDLTVNAAGVLNVFNGTAGKTLNASKNITNNGTIDFSKTGSVLVLNGATPQTIGGTGTLISSTIASLTFNNASTTRAITFNWTNTIISGTLNFANGRVALGAGNNMTLGTSGTSLGTLAYTAGNGFTSGAFGRWFGLTGSGTTIASGTIPTFGAGSFPFILGNGNACHFHRATAALTTEGVFSVEFTGAIGTSTISSPPTEGTFIFDKKSNSIWNTSLSNGYASVADHSFAIQGQGTYTAFSTSARLLFNDMLVGTNQTGTSQPMVQRTAIPASNIAGSYTIGIVGSELPNISVSSGAWNNPATWSAGVPVCGQNILINATDSIWIDGSMAAANSGQIILNGKLSVQGSSLTMGCSNKNNIFTVNGTFTLSGGTVTLNGNLNAAAGSVFAHTGGTINVDGNDAGLTATSVLSGTPLVNIATGNVTLSGGLFKIIDPHAGTVSASNSRAFYYSGGTAINTTTGWTLQFGDGISTDAGGDTANVGFVLDMAGSKIVIDSLVINAGVSGIRRFVTLNNGTTVGCNNMNITSNGEARISAATYIAKNLVNNGRLINTAGAVAFGTFLSATGGTSPNVQTISGTGTFRNSLTASTASFTDLIINNNNPSGVTFTADSVLMGGTNTGTVSGTFTLTNGIINTVSDTFVLGVSTGTLGTLTYTAGGFSSGSLFSRWWGTAVAGQTITAGGIPAAGVGTYPFVKVQSSAPLTFYARHAYVRQTVASVTGGLITIKHTDATGTSASAIVDGSYTVETRTNANWNISSTGITGTPTYTVALSGTGTYEGINSRIVQAAAPLNGTHQNGTSLPHAQRTSLTISDLTATWYMGAANSDISFYSIASGNWENGAIWNKGVAPSCSDSVIIRDGNIVTVNTVASTARAIAVSINGKLVVSGSSLTVGCTMNNASIRIDGNFTVSGGTVNVNGLIANNPSGRFQQSGGSIIIDGNDNGNIATSAVTHLMDAYATTDTSFVLAGGSITIVDPVVLTGAGYCVFKVYPTNPINASTTHTLILGDGISTQPGNATNAFQINLLGPGVNYVSLGNVVVNSNYGSNRHVITANTIGILGNLTITKGNYRMTSTHIVKGNIVNNDSLTNTGTLNLATSLNAVIAVNTTAQSISGTGKFYNSTTAPTAGMASLTINNNSVGGVTISTPLSVSGTLTLTRGIVNTTSTDTFRLGALTASATLSGGHDSAYINGPFSRTFNASRTATGTYTTAATLYPVGKSGRYLPMFIDPTTNAGGRSIISAEAFTSNTGTIGSGVISKSNLRWQSTYTDAANFVSANMRLTDTAAAFTTTTKIVSSATAGGVYSGAPVVITYAAGPPKTISTSSQILAADYLGNFTYGELVICAIPANQPTAFVAGNLGATAFDGSYTAAVGGASHYLVVRYATGATPLTPSNFTNYAVNATMGTGIVVANTTGTTFTQTGLTAGTVYDYYIYAYNNSACSGPIYKTTSPLLATVTTCAAAVTVPVSAAAVNTTSTSFVARWNPIPTPGATYIVDVSTNSGFTSFISGYNALSTSADTFVVVTGLSGNTTYYFRARAVDGLCVSTGSLTQNITTLCNPVASLPWAEGFESVAPGTNVFPGCWNYSNASSNWTIVNNSSYTGTQSLRRTWSTDGWAFTPTITLTAGTAYIFSYYLRTADNTTPAYDITVGVGTGQNAAAMTTTLSTVTNYQSTTWTKVTHTFTPVTAGNYTFGIRVVAPVNPNGINFDEMRVEELVAPSVITGTKTTITQTGVNISGSVVSAGGGTITTSGFVIGTSPNPTIGGPGVVDSTYTPAVQSGSFNKTVLGLTGSTLYHYRAYAINAAGTTYGADSTFTTLGAPVLATVSSTAAVSITGNSASISGSIASDGGASITQSGIVYSTTPNPTIGGVSVVDSTTTPLVTFGPFTINPAGLNHSTKYYYRAYAINSVGTAYSNQDSFTTQLIINSLPYTENFDGATTPWTAVATGGTNSWVRGTPAKTYLNGAYSAPNAFVTLLTGSYNGTEDCAVLSPQFNFTTQTNDPILRFMQKFKTDNDPGYDGMVIEISINGGAWTRLNNALGTGSNRNTPTSYSWYNDASGSGSLGPNIFNGISNTYASADVNGWIESATVLTGAAGQPNVRVRFHFWADTWVDEGNAIDNIEVVDVTAPTTAASVVNLTNITGNSTTVNWTNGNGQGRLVVARLATTAAIAPTNNLLYNPSPAFGTADSTGMGNKIVFKGATSLVTVSNLDQFTNYTYDVYEYNGKYMHIRFAAAASNSGTTLPVTLTNFNATAKAKDALLNWTTASETNNQGFTIERSLDGRSFESVGFVKGAGNSTQTLNYAYTDVAAFAKAGVWYYRLKQVDMDGKYAYSQIVRVSINTIQVSSVSVHPNPFKSDYTISFSAAKQGEAQLDLIDIQGRVVTTTQLNVTEGSNILPVTESAALQPGIYFLKLTINGESQMLKLVKE